MNVTKRFDWWMIYEDWFGLISRLQKKDDKSWIYILVDGKINKTLSAKYFLSK